MSGKKIIKLLVLVGLGVAGFYVTSALAAESNVSDLLNNLGDTYQSIGKIMIATSYLAGFGLTIAAIFKFKQHKDNPQQVPMGTPIAILLVGIALIFLPNIIAPAGYSIFGTGATTGGFKGAGISVVPGANSQ